MKHLIILLFTTILFSACVGHSYRKDKKYADKIHHRDGRAEQIVSSAHIDILQATKNSYQAGIVGVAGTTYSFDVYTKTEGITFGKVWLSNTKTFAIRAVDVETSLRPTTTKNRKLSFKITDPKNNQAIGDRLPVTFEGDAVVQYFLNGKAYYLVVNSIKELETKVYD
jgi:hypothetical protein